MASIIESINTFVWGAPALLLIIGVGIFLTLRLGVPQLTLFPEAFRAFFRQLLPDRSGEGKSSFRSLCTALAATVGTGNLVGVAGAICLGGPGAVFWMWVCGFLGMATKYAEAALAVRYHRKTDQGYTGGTMYTIRQALPRWAWFLAPCYAFFGLIASFGVGNVTQINAAVTGIREALSCFRMEMTPALTLAVTALLAALTGLLFYSGARHIGDVAQRLVPIAAAGYMLMCLGVLFWNWRRIPNAIMLILRGAFSPRAATGGIIGASFQSLRVGCSRGVFTNEAGMGTASIAHAGAEDVHPVQQGMMGIVEVFLDTIVICTLTALVILVSGVPIPYGQDAGAALTGRAFSTAYGSWASVLLAVSMVLFAVAAVLGWGLYGGRCAEFLFGPGSWPWFTAAQTVTVFAGSYLQTGLLWQLSEALNGLMVIPNLITLAVLTPETARLTKEYKKIRSQGGRWR